MPEVKEEEKETLEQTEERDESNFSPILDEQELLDDFSEIQYSKNLP